MKTITIILTALILQVNSLFASSDGVPVKVNNEINITIIVVIAPVTPKEAIFEETVTAVELLVFAPVTPKVATFEDETEDINITCLAPTTPAEADFNDPDFALNPARVLLAPVTPAEADFNELP